MKFKLIFHNEYEVEAESKDEATEKLIEKFNRENMTAETEFWENIEVNEVN